MPDTRVLMALSLSLASAAAGQTPQGQQPAQTHHDRAAEDPFRVQPLSGNVYALYGRGGNVGVYVGADAALVVDSQFEPTAPALIRKIQGITDKPIKYLVNTHHHGDHVGGNSAFRPLAVILAHDSVRKRMLTNHADVLRDNPARIEEARKAGNADLVKRLEQQLEDAKKVKVEEIPAPMVTFDSEARIHIGDETIHVWHTPPAHTDGDGVVFFEKAGVVHMGDLMFHKTIPVIDVRGGGTPKGYLGALDKVIERVPATVKVIPGHGEVTDVAGIRAFREYIADIVDAAQKAKAAGKSKDDFVNQTELAKYKDFTGYPQRFKGNLAAAYDEAR